jgi:hypothetical protein
MRTKHFYFYCGFRQNCFACDKKESAVRIIFTKTYTLISSDVHLSDSKIRKLFVNIFFTSHLPYEHNLIHFSLLKFFESKLKGTMTSCFIFIVDFVCVEKSIYLMFRLYKRFFN